MRIRADRFGEGFGCGFKPGWEMPGAGGGPGGSMVTWKVLHMEANGSCPVAS